MERGQQHRSHEQILEDLSLRAETGLYDLILESHALRSQQIDTTHANREMIIGWAQSKRQESIGQAQYLRQHRMFVVIGEARMAVEDLKTRVDGDESLVTPVHQWLNERISQIYEKETSKRTHYYPWLEENTQN